MTLSVTLRPNATGTPPQLSQYPASGNNWDKVDEETSDGDLTYVYDYNGIGTEKIDLYNITDPQLPSEAIVKAVKIYALCRSLPAYDADFKIKIQTGGSIFSGSLFGPPETYTLYSVTYLTNPNTGQLWTADDVKNLLVGIGIASYTDVEGRCTQIYAVVEYELVIQPAKCRIEIFRDPTFFDEHFNKYTWTETSAIKTLDGDVAKITITSGTYGQTKHVFPSTLNSDTNRYLIIRCTAFVGTDWLVGLKLGAINKFSKVFTSTGLKIINLYDEGGLFDYDTLVIAVDGVVDNYVEIDYVSICETNLLIPEPEDLVEQLSINKSLLSKGINSANVTLPNFAGAYTGLIKNKDRIIIWLARNEANLGLPSYKEFGGEVMNPVNRGKDYGSFYIDLECHGYAYELNVPPSVLKGIYSAVNGRIIIEDALALCTYLVKHPVATKWFDNTGSSGSTDDRINSTHDVIYDEEIPMVVLQEILEKAKNPAAVQGFDVYEAPSGVLVGHLRNSLDFVSSITIIPQSYQKGEDLHRVRNKIKVYGEKNGRGPATDAWCESLDNWTYSGTSLTLDSADKKVGGYSIKLIATTSCWMKRTFGVVTTVYPREFKQIVFWAKTSLETPNRVKLLAPDDSNYFAKNLDPLITNEWQLIIIPVGPENDDEWYKIGNPNWSNIQGFVWENNATVSQTHRVDDLHFAKRAYEALAEDSASQIAYGVRILITEDEGLKSDAECLARAQSLLAISKDPLITVQKVVIDGDNGYNPGDRQRIVVSNDALDAYFRIIEIEEVLKGTQWDITLTLNNEPQYVDYVFKLIQEAQKLLERRT